MSRPETQDNEGKERVRHQEETQRPEEEEEEKGSFSAGMHAVTGAGKQPQKMKSLQSRELH